MPPENAIITCFEEASFEASCGKIAVDKNDIQCPNSMNAIITSPIWTQPPVHDIINAESGLPKSFDSHRTSEKLSWRDSA